MQPPVRMVCGDCLRSVELLADDSGRLPTLCPACGGTMDSRLGELETPTSNFALPPGPAGGPGEPRWSETWSKGSLGTVGRFLLRELLGDGGFGRVYQAYDPRLDRDVALKVLKPADPGERVMQRFFREARAAARLSHPNIVGVLDAGYDAGRCWIAYEYVAGKTLSRQPDGPRADIAAAVRVTRDLAGALDYAHREGVVHRDLKPANVLIDGAGRPRLIDFGLARRSDLDSDLTRDGAVLGTPAYMAPEQADGRSHLADGRSDVFGLGVILYELLCGRRPAETPSAAAAWQVKPAGPPPPLRPLNPEVPAALERMVLRSLAPAPEDRYPDAKAFARDLDHWLKTRHGQITLSPSLTAVVIGLGAMVLLFVGLSSLRREATGTASAPAAVTPAPVPTAPAAVHPPSNDRSAAADPSKELHHEHFCISRKSDTYHVNPQSGYATKPCGPVQLIKQDDLLYFDDLVGERRERKTLTPCGHCFPRHSAESAR